MQYLMLIYHSEAAFGKSTEADRAAVYQEYGQLREELSAKGKFVGGNQLAATTVATSVRVREGKRIVTDGPFAETKEQLAGYFLVEANDQDEAIAIAARIPSARNGTIEVRPIAVRGKVAQA
ncbi:MAG TPA: YciI family protein [Candidatus Acidoferrum sp.]